MGRDAVALPEAKDGLCVESVVPDGIVGGVDDDAIDESRCGGDVIAVAHGLEGDGRQRVEVVAHVKDRGGALGVGECAQEE